jgi:hypothetical protein
MPRFYFHVSYRGHLLRDALGVELADEDEAQRELLRLACLLPSACQEPATKVMVFDAEGAVVAEHVF